METHFDFERAYVLRALNAPTIPPRLAIGVRPWTYDPATPGGPRDTGLAMLVAGSDHGFSFRTIHVASRPDGAVRALDGRNTTDRGNPVVWLFEPLTVDRWKKVAEEAGVTGFDELVPQLTTDSAVQNFYVGQFLAAYWRKQWERDQAGGSAETPAAPPEPAVEALPETEEPEAEPPASDANPGR